ncbi:hypothetical protein T01_11403 [Trichinella spiralis]|uniref:Uncharacterized protein n=1 Tax=Trichinella spiralis TaxID=6334 RepID=A0A0V1AT69_TRISP|nr:hypothetical protein T01_11403 [Trichinella spiralis]
MYNQVVVNSILKTQCQIIKSRKVIHRNIELQKNKMVQNYEANLSLLWKTKSYLRIKTSIKYIEEWRRGQHEANLQTKGVIHESLIYNSSVLALMLQIANMPGAGPKIKADIVWRNQKASYHVAGSSLRLHKRVPALLLIIGLMVSMHLKTEVGKADSPRRAKCINEYYKAVFLTKRQEFDADGNRLRCYKTPDVLVNLSVAFAVTYPRLSCREE